MAKSKKRWFGDFRAYEGKKIGWSKRTGGTGWKRIGDKWVQIKDGKPTGRKAKYRIGTTALSMNNPDQWEGSKPSNKKRDKLSVNKSRPKVKSVGTVDFNVNTAGGLAAYNKAQAAAKTSGAKTDQAKDRSTTEAAYGERNRQRAKKSNVFTKHYKTGKELGVMSRRERRAYEKEAGTKTWESEKKRLGATGNKQNTKASSKSWRRKRELELAKKDQTTIRESKNSTERKKQKLFSLGPTQYTV